MYQRDERAAGETPTGLTEAERVSHTLYFWRIYPSWDAYVTFSRTTSASGSFLSLSSFSTATVAPADATTDAVEAAVVVAADAATDSVSRKTAFSNTEPLIKGEGASSLSPSKKKSGNVLPKGIALPLAFWYN